MAADRGSVPYASRPWRDQDRALFGLPGLCVSIRCKPDGVHVDADLHSLVGPSRRGLKPIAHVVFKPREVTETLIVQWAIGALSAYLQSQAEAVAEAVVEQPQ